MEYRRDGIIYSALMLAARITLPHFSVSSATSFPNSAGVTGMGWPTSSAKRACNLGTHHRVHRLIEFLDDLGWRAPGRAIPFQMLTS